ncbi:MAG TPA: hypothetical protein VGF76_11260 [Polyangiaceae bacterium]|jgi:hypothetical protein
MNVPRKPLLLGLTALGLVLYLAACSSKSSDAGSGAAQAGATAAMAGSSGAPGSAGAVNVAGATATAGSAGEPVSGGAASGGAASGGAAAAGSPAGGSAGSATGGSAGSAGGGTVLSGTVKIMVLGSSNELITCWRALLWQKLETANIKNFDFVGGVTSGPDNCGVTGYDKDLQAESGIIISNLAASDFAGWFTAHPPQVILMHFGGADLLMNMPIDGVIKGYSLALAQARLVNPAVRLLIAQHTPEGKDTVVTLNADIVTWAMQNTTAASPITVVDLYTGLDPVNDFSDGVHLNPAGSEKVASRWFTALQPILKP